MKTILCFGDSNTWGYDPTSGNRFPRGVRWTSLLQDALPDCYVVEEGLNGRTTVFEDDQRDDRRGISQLSMILKSHDPIDLVILMLGTNDCKRRLHACAAEITEGMQSIVELIQSPKLLHLRKAPDILVMAPPPIGEEALAAGGLRFQYDSESVSVSQELGKFYKQMAQFLGLRFFDAGDVTHMGPDGLHLSAEGHALLASALADYLINLI